MVGRSPSTFVSHSLPVHSWCRWFWKYFYLKPIQSTGQRSLIHNSHIALSIRTDGTSVFLGLFPVIWERCCSWLFRVTALKAQLRSNFHYVLSTRIPCPIRSWILRGAWIMVRFILFQVKSLLESVSFDLWFTGWLDCTGMDFSVLLSTWWSERIN